MLTNWTIKNSKTGEKRPSGRGITCCVGLAAAFEATYDTRSRIVSHIDAMLLEIVGGLTELELIVCNDFEYGYSSPIDVIFDCCDRGEALENDDTCVGPAEFTPVRAIEDADIE